jgi:hypothetical protein
MTHYDTYDIHTCHDNCQHIACVLRRELAAVTEQRDGIEAKLRIELRGHQDSELWGDAGLIAATMRCFDAVEKLTEQRDRMAKLLSDIHNYAKGKKQHDYYKLTESDRIIAAFDAWQEIESKIEQLLQTTPTQTEQTK